MAKATTPMRLTERYQTILDEALQFWDSDEPVREFTFPQDKTAKSVVTYLRRKVLPQVIGWTFSTKRRGNTVYIQAWPADTKKPQPAPAKIYAARPDQSTPKEDKPVLTEEQFSNSQLTKLKQCTKAYDYRYVQNLKRKTTSKAPTLGTWVHLALAADRIARGLDAGSLLAVPEELDPRRDDLSTVKVYADDLLLGYGAKRYPLSAEGIVQILEDHVYSHEPDFGDDEYMPDKVLSIIMRYREAHKDWQTEEPLLVEYRWERTHEKTGVRYTGTVDAVTRRADGLVVVRDTKTHAELPNHTQRLINSQLNLYTWGIVPVLKAHGIKPHSIEWDYIKTKSPSPVRFTQAGNLHSGMGPTDEWTVRNTAADAVVDAVRVLEDKAAEAKTEATKQKHLDTINKLSELEVDDILDVAVDYNNWFERVLQPINVTAIRTILEENAAAISAYESVDRQPVRSPSWFGCRMCEFSSLCEAEMYGNDTDELLAIDYTKEEDDDIDNIE